MISEQNWQKLEQQVLAIVDQQGVELWDMEFKQEGHAPVLRIYIDKPDKVTVDDCANVSERVSLMLDVEELIEERYTLEVSSPGMDRKLVRPEHYQRYIDRIVTVKLEKDVPGRKMFTGRLKSMADGTLVLEDEHERQQHEISIDDVREARLVIEFTP